MDEAVILFESAIDWLKQEYASIHFFVERDVVWTIQKYLAAAIKDQSLPYSVYNDYPILRGERRSVCTDLAIIDSQGVVEVAAEIKYEPAHRRDDIWPSKFPVVFWGREGVEKDIERVQNYVNAGRAKAAYSVFIDEGSFFRHREAPLGSNWIDWEVRVVPQDRVSVLFFVAQAAPDS